MLVIQIVVLYLHRA